MVAGSFPSVIPEICRARLPRQEESRIYQGGGAQLRRKTFNMSGEGTARPSDLSQGAGTYQGCTLALELCTPAVKGTFTLLEIRGVDYC